MNSPARRGGPTASLSRIPNCARRLDHWPISVRCAAGPPADSNTVTSGPTEVDPVLRAPLPQNRFLGFVRKIVPQLEGAPPHQQILISAVSASSAEDVANLVVVVG